MMTIQVVKSAEVTEDFITYRGLLCYHSKYFESLPTGSFKEGGATTYRVTSCTPQIFAMFYNWMNTGVAWMGDEDFLAHNADMGFDVALDLYVFADYHEIYALRNHAVEMCCKWFHDGDDEGLVYIEEIYERTPKTSPLRRLAVNTLVDVCDFEQIEKHLGSISRADIFLDVMEVCNKQGVVPGVASKLMVPGWRLWRHERSENFCEWYHDHPAAA